MALGALLALWIFLALFTTLFTNLNGIATAPTPPTAPCSTAGTARCPPRRAAVVLLHHAGAPVRVAGDLPRLAGLVTLAVTIARRLIRRDFRHDPRLLFRILVASWMVFMFVVLSWAGEKMPWLIMHIVLPAALLGGLVVDDFAAAVRRWYRAHNDARWRSPVALGGALVLLAGSFFFIAANLTWGGFGANLDAPRRAVRTDALNDWWMLTLPPVAALLVIGVTWLLRGRTAAVAGTVAGLLAIMLLYQVHAGFRLSFIDGDVSVDTMIYNTVGPDAKQVAEDIHATSALYLGDDSITVSNDQCTNWPMEWYLKDLPNYRFMRTVDEASGDLPMFIIGVPNSFTGDPCVTSFPDEIPGYVSQTYVFAGTSRNQ